jgi:hypothetical protein
MALSLSRRLVAERAFRIHNACFLSDWMLPFFDTVPGRWDLWYRGQLTRFGGHWEVSHPVSYTLYRAS